MMAIKSVVVIGSGTMGAGIAQWFASKNISTYLTDVSEAQLNAAKEKIFSSWEKLAEAKKISDKELTQFKSVIYFTRWDQTPKETTLVIEAIVENLEIKQKLFLDLNAYFCAETYFASNTSSFTMKSLCQFLPEARVKRFLGLHFFNPATIMKLVEIIRGPQISEKEVQAFYAWFEAQGKIPALSSDAPGFIVNRIARNFYGETLRCVKLPTHELLSESDIEACQDQFREIDRLMREVGGFKMGPFELMDLIGIDVNLSVTKSVWSALDQTARLAPHLLQESLVSQKRFGRKNGKGFYQY
jgi:3-hydroxybutyryl-CoA dehydrogenase